MLEPQLRRVINVLILAAAARAEVSAFRRDALRRRCDDAQQLGPREILFHLRDFHLDRFADDDERHKNHKIINPPHALAAEREVVDGQVDLIADLERHPCMLVNFGAGKSLFTRRIAGSTRETGNLQPIPL